jgi:hypothetical protein
LPSFAVLDRRPVWCLVAIAVVSSVLRFGIAIQIHTPLFYPDEYLYAALARGIGHGTVGQLRGGPVALATTISYFAPFVTAPAWLLSNVDVAYRLAQAMGSVAFASAAFPAYFLARRTGISSRGALLAAVLAVLAPAGAFTATLLSESYAYPLVLTACLIAVTAIASPTTARLAAVVVVGVGLLPVGGLQLAVFLPSCVGAYLLGARSLRAARRRVSITAGCVGLGAIVVIAVRHNPQAASALDAARLFHEDVGSMAGWLGVNAFVLAIGAGWVIVPGAVLGLKLLAGTSDVARAFAALTVLFTTGCLVEAAAWSAGTQGRGAYERFVIYPVPLLAIGFVAWLESGETRRRVFSGLAYALVLAAVLVPLSSGLHVESDNAPTLTGLATLGPGTGAVVWAPILTLLAAAVALVGTLNRNWVAVAAVGVAAATSIATAHAYVDFSAHRPAPRVDSGSNAAYVTYAQADGVYLMRSLFWNPNITRVLVVGGGEAPDSYPSTSVTLNPAGGLTDAQGRAVAGPFVVGPGTLVLGQSRALPRADGLATVQSAPRVIVFGWYRDDDALSPFARFLIAGGSRGTRLELSLQSGRMKRLELRCSDGPARIVSVGEAATTLTMRSPAQVTTTCELRLVAGTVDVVDGHETSVHGRLRLAATT